MSADTEKPGSSIPGNFFEFFVHKRAILNERFALMGKNIPEKHEKLLTNAAI